MTISSRMTGARFRAEREALGLRRGELANRLGVSRPQVYALEQREVVPEYIRLSMLAITTAQAVSA